MITSTFVMATSITLLSVLVSYLTSRYRDRFPRDVRIIFKTGQSVRVKIAAGTPDYQAAQKIGSAVDNVLFPNTREIVRPMTAKDAFSCSLPIIAQTRMLNTEKVSSIDKLVVVVPPTKFLSIEKSGMSKHVEMRPLNKERKITATRSIVWGPRAESYSAASRKEHTSDRNKGGFHWMQKHGEEYPVAAG